MSVREYIGARYVPIFASPLEWDQTKTYEPLTIVLYQGNSFTSRQYVPAGIGIDNTAYWAQTGNYNAQVEQYRAEVETYDDRITNNATDIDTLEDALPSYRKKANKAKVMCIGDSWGTGYGESHGWPWYLEQTGMFETVYSSVQGGYSFNKTDASYITLLTNVLTSQTQRDDIDILVAIGGANAPSSAGNKADVIAFVNAAKTYYPNADIYIAANGPNIISKYRKNCMSDIEAGGRESGAIVLHELSTLTLLGQNWTTDNWHRTSYKEIGEGVANLIMGGSIHYAQVALRNDSTQYVAGSLFPNASRTFMIGFTNGSKVNFNMAVSFGVVSSDVSIPANQTVPILINKLRSITLGGTSTFSEYYKYPIPDTNNFNISLPSGVYIVVCTANANNEVDGDYGTFLCVALHNTSNTTQSIAASVINNARFTIDMNYDILEDAVMWQIAQNYGWANFQ